MVRTSKKRDSHGGTTALVAVCGIILVAVIVAAIQLSMTLTTSQTARNSVEAGALNIATHAPELKVMPSGGNEGQFSDVADSSGQISLTNINRVWGKALLENLNAKEMLNNGQAGNSQGNATNAYAGASALNDRLSGMLNDTGKLNGFFTALTSSGGTGSSLGASASSGGVSAGSGGGSAPAEFDTAFVHRGEESNLSFSSNQLPQDAQVNITPIEKGASFLPGYKVIEVNGNKFIFVTFRQGEMPHLLSLEEFQSSTAKTNPLNAGSVLPNAFFASGNLQNSATRAAANAVANPQKSYKLAIPHAYVTIHLEKNQANWMVSGKKAAESTYEYAPETQWQVKSYDVGCRKSQLNGYASIGNEYTGTLLNAITALPGNHKPVFDKMVQRMREIDSAFSDGRLQSLLKSQKVVPGIYDYVLYPTYSSADNTDPTIKIAPLNQVSSPWFKQAEPDGSEKTIATDQRKDEPNRAWGQVIGPWKLTRHDVQVDGQLKWTPGTGVNQSLGKLRIQRTATITFDGRCP